MRPSLGWLGALGLLLAAGCIAWMVKLALAEDLQVLDNCVETGLTLPSGHYLKHPPQYLPPPPPGAEESTAPPEGAGAGTTETRKITPSPQSLNALVLASHAATPPAQAPESIPAPRSADSDITPAQKSKKKTNPDVYVAFGDFNAGQLGAADMPAIQKNDLREKARSAYQDALTLDPNHKGALQGMARLYTITGDHEGAVVTYRKVAEKHPKDAALIDELVRILKRTKSRDTFILTAALLAKLEAPKEKAIPVIIRGAERLGITDGAIWEKEDAADTNPIVKVIRLFLEDGAAADEPGSDMGNTAIGGLVGAALGQLVGQPAHGDPAPSPSGGHLMHRVPQYIPPTPPYPLPHELQELQRQALSQGPHEDGVPAMPSADEPSGNEDAADKGVVAGGAIGGLIGAAAGALTGHREEEPPHGQVCQLAARWESTVAETLDPANGGKPLRGLVGRVYLFDADMKETLKGGSDLIIDLYDDRGVKDGRKPIHLERWQFPVEALEQLQRKDAIGWGYTLFLPWSSIRPEHDRVHVEVTYQEHGTTPVSTQTQTFKLNHPSGQLTAPRLTPSPRLQPPLQRRSPEKSDESRGDACTGGAIDGMELEPPQMPAADDGGAGRESNTPDETKRQTGTVPDCGGGQVICRWESSIFELPTTDTCGPEVPMPCIGGFVYLYNEKEKEFVCGTGELVVDLYDERGVADGGCRSIWSGGISPAKRSRIASGRLRSLPRGDIGCCSPCRPSARRSGWSGYESPTTRTRATRSLPRMRG